MREASAEFAALFQAAVDAMIVIDAGGVVLDVNPSAERLFGHDRDAVIGQDVAMLMPEPHRSRHADYIVRFLTSGEAKIIGKGRQVEGERADGSQFPMELAVGEVVAGGAARFVGIVRDLTIQKAAEEEARRLQNRLAHVGRFSTMGEMAAGLAHEINQPLSAITTYAEAGKRLLDQGADASDLTELCQKIANQARRAGQVIENLRNFIRKQEVQKEHLDLNAVVADIVSLINADARAEGIIVDVDYCGEPLPVSGDAIQIQQVLVNLTRNAVDAMKQGLYKDRGIHVQTRRRDAHTAEINVTDYGHGVPAQLADSIFHPFVSTKGDGLGIGLAISRTIAQSHGGDLAYRPNPAGGSVFGFSLPISKEK
jgi:two-component system sensor kinase FixL